MPFDIQLFYLLNSLAGQQRVFDELIVFLALYLPYLIPFILLVLVFCSAYSRREKWELVLVAAVSSIIARAGVTELIRYFYHRPRPFTALDTPSLFTDTAWSFPSGHATFFFAMATAVYLYNKKWGIGFFIATILITMSRVIAGVHYPSDILDGAAIGILVAYATAAVVRHRTAQNKQSDILT